MSTGMRARVEVKTGACGLGVEIRDEGEGKGRLMETRGGPQPQQRVGS